MSNTLNVRYTVRTRRGTTQVRHEEMEKQDLPDTIHFIAFGEDEQSVAEDGEFIKEKLDFNGEVEVSQASNGNWYATCRREPVTTREDIRKSELWD